MIRIAIITIVLGLLSACSYPIYMTDQHTRQRIFSECLNALPQETRNSEAIKQCDLTAESQAYTCVENCRYTDYKSPDAPQ